MSAYHHDNINSGFSLGTTVPTTNKTDNYNKTVILLNVVLNTNVVLHTNNPYTVSVLYMEGLSCLIKVSNHLYSM